MRAAHTGSLRSVAAEPKIHIARLALVMATLRRRTSARKPTPPLPPLLARTQLKMMTSSCLPWKLSTVSIRICKSVVHYLNCNTGPC